MPSKVFDRAMFKAESKPTKADSGIMQGFDADEEIPEDEMMEEVSQRRPNSPEILMNNLRGDVRSVDARYQELAGLVGDQAAQETPPEVLALLQAQLAQQGSMGIGGLPPGQGVSPPPQMPAGAPPMPAPQMGGIPQQAPMPMDQGQPAPQGFSHGGIASLQTGTMYTHGASHGADPSFQSGPVFTEGVAHAGRNGDTVLAHITPEQEQYLTELGGGKTINPTTGLPEHWLGAIPAMSNIAARVGPMAQQANVLAGRLLYNPTFTAPTLNQTRTTLGTFGPKIAEGMELYYPTFTQGLANTRGGQMAIQAGEKIANMPMVDKALTAMGTTAVGKFISDKLGSDKNMVAGNKNAPVIPGDTATGWVPPEPPAVSNEPNSSPINWNNVPAAPVTEGDKTQQFIDKNQAATPATRTNRLEKYMEENLPIFEKYMGTGGDKSFNQAQALFLLSDMGLKFASKRRPGSTFATNFAESAQGVPTGLAQIAAQEEMGKRQVRGAALSAGLAQLAAEDKQALEIFKALQKSGQISTTDLGAGRSEDFNKSTGQSLGMKVDPQVTSSFLASRFTPQTVKDDSGKVTGLNTPYATVLDTPQTFVKDKDIATSLAKDISRKEKTLSQIDGALNQYTGAFGKGAWFSKLDNNYIVPLFGTEPNLKDEEKKTQIWLAMKEAVRGIASGSNDEIGIKTQQYWDSILGDKPGTFWSNDKVALKNILTLRTAIANDRLAAASQLGWINKEIRLEVPNLGTPSDPIPKDKMTHLYEVAKANPNGTVYVDLGGGNIKPVQLSTLKQ